MSVDSCGLVVHALRSLRLLLFEPPGNFPVWSRFVWIRVDWWFALFFPWSAIQSPSVVKQPEPFLHHFLHLADRKCLICNGPVAEIAPLARAGAERCGDRPIKPSSTQFKAQTLPPTLSSDL